MRRIVALEEPQVHDVVVFGAGPVAELADFYLQSDAGRRVVAFTVDSQYIEATEFAGRPVVPFESLPDRFPPAQYDFFAAISYTRLNKLRREKVDMAAARGYKITNYISSRATRFAHFTEKENQFILEDNTIQPFSKIGRNVTLWSGNHIGHHSEIGEDVFIASHVVISGGVKIGARTFIGVNATIRDHVSIGADCIIGAGALVLSDIPDGSVVSPSGTEISRVPSSRIRRI